MRKFNVLLVNTGSLGRVNEVYGYPVRTPHLTALACDGVTFRQAFATSGTFGLSVASLALGQYPHSCGAIGLAHRGFVLDSFDHHVAHVLGRAGWRTGICGFSSLDAKSWREPGFQDGIDPGPRCESLIPNVRQWMAESTQPFFLWCGVNLRWHGAVKGGTEDERFIRALPQLPDTPETRRDTAMIYNEARQYDAIIGGIMESLDELGLRENTIVIVTADSGPSLPGMKCNLTDAGTGVTLIVRGPRATTLVGGNVIDSMVSQLDVMPTLYDLLQLPQPDWLDGKSLLPLVHGETDLLHTELYFEQTYHACYEPVRSVRTADFRYTRRFGPHHRVALPNCDESATKTLLIEKGWQTRIQPREALYDLTFDPNETDNLCGKRSYADVLADLRERLDEWMLTTQDPLLHGDIPMPPGAVANHIDQTEATEPTLTAEELELVANPERAALEDVA